MKIPYSVWALEDSHLVKSDIQKYLQEFFLSSIHAPSILLLTLPMSLQFSLGLHLCFLECQASQASSTRRMHLLVFLLAHAQTGTEGLLAIWDT